MTASAYNNDQSDALKLLGCRNKLQRELRRSIGTTRKTIKAPKLKPLLPQIIGTVPITNSDGKRIQILVKTKPNSGIVDVGGELWTTQKLVDELFHCLRKIEAEPNFMIIPVTDDRNIIHETVDISQSFESVNTVLYKKYIIRAEKLAGSYCKEEPIFFIINLSDLDERLQAELIDLQSAKSRSTLRLVLHLAVERIFALASLSWFYESAGMEIRVIIQP